MSRTRVPIPEYIVAWLGVDPGKKGAYVIFTEKNTIEIYDWPSDDNYQTVAEQMKELKHRYIIRLAILEKVASMHGQGVKSVWSFGQNYGAWRMLLASLKIKHRLMTTTSWQKGLITKTDGPDPKSRVKNTVCNLFGPNHFLGPRGAYKDGRGDAALMAYKAKIIDLGK